ncbi:hypothetical protein L6164_016620 [Bauhinia variegata]|uniref:Uncharacterized protein n=1 Tax=Bauhinia variegata TaxID=167791 RepID=A0ACB9NNX6_BAUVA|nr:hypothetical protein L6164_016620 [Bauhinia variegata]
MNSKMQPVLILPLSPIFKFSYSPLDWDESANISGKFIDDLRKKLKNNFKVNLKMEENLRNEAVEEKKQVDHEDNQYKTYQNEEEEFSFNCTNFDVSMVSAEDVFVNGKIRPMFPIIADGYDSGSPMRPPLKKLFIQRPESCFSSLVMTKSEDLNEAPRGRNSNWPKKLAVDSSPEKHKKSNSTGISKRWRFRELFHRSKFHGKSETEKVNIKTNDLIEVKVPKDMKIRTTLSANEIYYLNNKATKESDKQRSYLPYKLWFFADVNGMSRKVHLFK